MRALIVDDSALARLRLAAALKQEGFTEVVEAASGGEALQCLLATTNFDVAFVDCVIPGGIGGLDLVEAIRANCRFDSMKVLVVSAENDSSEINRALSAGADGYVTKPFSNDIIHEHMVELGLRPAAISSAQSALSQHSTSNRAVRGNHAPRCRHRRSSAL